MDSLKLPKNNIYFDGEIIANGDKLLLKRKKINYNFNSERDERHFLKAGETLSSLAYKYYDDSKLAFILADVNNIYNPFILEPGSIILIPDKEIIESLR